MKTVVLNVEGMMCGHCESRIHTALTEISGIENVKADAQSNHVTCIYDEAKVNLDSLKEAIEDVGYEVK